jgi:phosphoglycolate phosphatase
MEQDKTLVFDFDGTIADSIEVLVEIARRITMEYGYGEISRADIASLKQMSVYDGVEKLKIPLRKLPFLIAQGKKELSREIENVALIPGMKETLVGLKNKGFTLGILTSNSKENVTKFLRKNNLNCFSFIYSGRDLLGKDKVIRRMLSERRLARKEVIYLGDEIRDIEACKKIGVKIAAVSWGLSSREALERYEPDWVIDSPQELLDLVA